MAKAKSKRGRSSAAGRGGKTGSLQSDVEVYLAEEAPRGPWSGGRAGDFLHAMSAAERGERPRSVHWKIRTKDGVEGMAWSRLPGGRYSVSLYRPGQSAIQKTLARDEFEVVSGDADEGSRPRVLRISRGGAMADRRVLVVDVQYPDEEPMRVHFAGPSGRVGPVVMIANGAQMFVSDPARFGPFGEDWVRKFFA